MNHRTQESAVLKTAALLEQKNIDKNPLKEEKQRMRYGKFPVILRAATDVWKFTQSIAKQGNSSKLQCPEFLIEVSLYRRD